MAIESLVGLAVFALIMLCVAIYADKHRAEDRHRKRRDG
jgi:hypothetical protein